MKLDLITLATVKTQLGISDSSFDATITAMIPIVSNDVRRILNTNFDDYIQATITNGSAEITMSDEKFKDYNYVPKLNMGQVLYSPSLPDDTYIKSYDPDTSIYTLSANATSTGDYFYPTIQISMFPAISKMIFYKIGKQTTSSATSEKFKSIRYGNVSKTFADNEINKKFDYPQIYIDELGVPFQRVG